MARRSGIEEPVALVPGAYTRMMPYFWVMSARGVAREQEKDSGVC